MAQTALSTLPRFLLPKISWQAAPTSMQCAIRAMSTIQTARNRDSRLHNTPRTPYLSQTNLTSCSILSSIQQRRAFSASPPHGRDHHFDTLKFVKRMREEGFSEEQSVAMMKVLSDVIEERYKGALISKFVASSADSVSQHSELNTHHGPPRRPSQSNLHPKSRLCKAPLGSPLDR